MVRTGAQDVSHAAADLEHMAEATCVRATVSSEGVEEAGGEPRGCLLVAQVGDQDLQEPTGANLWASCRSSKARC